MRGYIGVRFHFDSTLTFFGDSEMSIELYGRSIEEVIADAVYYK